MTHLLHEDGRGTGLGCARVGAPVRPPRHRDSGAGVLHWLLDEHPVHEAPELPPTQGDDSPSGDASRTVGVQIQLYGIGLLELRGGGAIDPPQSVDEYQPSHGAQHASRSLAVSASPHITGTRGGERVIVCGGCYQDIPLRGLVWRQCQCRTFRCGRCAASPCRTCGSTASEHLNELLQDSGEVRRGALAVDQADISFGEAAEFAWDFTFEAGDHGAVQPDSAMRCASCTVGSREVDVPWCFCVCGLSYCQPCYGQGCEACGARIPARRAAPLRGVDCLEAEGVSVGHLPSDRCSEDDDCLPMPVILTPEQAHQRRSEILEGVFAARRQERTAHRIQRRDQVRSGRRPRRVRRPSSSVTFATVNVSTAARLYEELKRGGGARRLRLHWGAGDSFTRGGSCPS